MAMCGVDGCDRAATGRKPYCEKHDYRFRKYGSPLGGRTPVGEPRRYLEEVVYTYQGDDCLIWPYARNSAGYGHLSVDGVNHLVHRLSCEHRHGPPPFPGAEAAHSCGNGHKGCCNQQHLRWDDTAGNFQDKREHGTLNDGEQHYGAKLTDADVTAIRASTDSQRSLAERFGVSQTNISAIKRGKSWKGRS